MKKLSAIVRLICRIVFFGFFIYWVFKENFGAVSVMGICLIGSYLEEIIDILRNKK